MRSFQAGAFVEARFERRIVTDADVINVDGGTRLARRPRANIESRTERNFYNIYFQILQVFGFRFDSF